MEKLEIKHIAPYLPYGVEVEYTRRIYPKETKRQILSINMLRLCEDAPSKFSIKPLLRPLSDLYKEIDGVVGIVELAKIAGCNIDLNKLPINEIETVNIVKNYEVEFKYSSGYYRYFIFRNGSFYYKTGHERRYGQDYEPLPQSNQLDLFTYLFQNHYDIWDLIGQNLAIDKSKIK